MHESTTDADAWLYKKSFGKESKLSYLDHVLVENRNGLIAVLSRSLFLSLFFDASVLFRFRHAESFS